MESLIKRERQQLDLIPSDQMPAAMFEADEASGTYTGERFFSNRPDTYRECCALLAEGIGILRIAKLLHVHPSTIRAVRDREAETIDMAKQMIAKRLRTGAEMCTDAILEALDDDKRRLKLAPRDAAVIAGILIDKWQLISGGATSRIEIIDAEPEHDDYLRALDDMRRVQAESIQVSPMDLGGASGGAKGVLGPVVGPAVGPAVGPVVGQAEGAAADDLGGGVTDV
jgi:hypothetical protein